jgi:probable rRNA maturation factor
VTDSGENDGDDSDDDDVPLEPFPFTSKRRRRPDEGTLEVFVADEQTLPVSLPKMQRLAESVLGAEGMGGDAELGMRFVDETIMGELNKRFMGADGPTDVLAFPMEDDLAETGRSPDNGTTGPSSDRTDTSEPPLLLGDVVVCPAVAARNASSRGVAYEDELALLVVHGVLHILGMDHAEPDEAVAMEAKQREYLARFHPATPES